MTSNHHYPIGRPGQPWTDQERLQWRKQQRVQRSYSQEVLARIDGLAAAFERLAYGELDYAPDVYPLFALRSKDWREALPVVLVTGGVHGYETSGVQGALQFLDEGADAFAGQVNLLVAPCVSPWAYERIQRWNAHAIDPNRSFREDSPAPESAALMRLIAPWKDRILLHVDLHETTDSDETEFRPALAAREGKDFEPGEIPDGFYLVGDSDNPQLAFHGAVIDEVAEVTHIAPADARGEIIGSPGGAPGVILYPLKSLGLCGGVTAARYTPPTGGYPDSPRTTPTQCNAAQVAAVSAAIRYALAHPE